MPIIMGMVSAKVVYSVALLKSLLCMRVPTEAPMLSAGRSLTPLCAGAANSFIYYYYPVCH
jgi:hypothetical protein